MVGDTGGAFFKSGRLDRVDLFVGSCQYEDFWSSKGFDHTKSFEAYKVTGAPKEQMHQWLKARFGELIP